MIVYLAGMTMIACTLNKATPVIIGDLLLSSSIKPDSFEVPLFSEDVMQYLSSDAKDHPILLNQKIYILKENVCIAFAGDVGSIVDILEDIRIYCNALDLVSSDKMIEFLEQNKNDQSWPATSFIVLVVDRMPDHFFVCKLIHGSWLKGQSETFGEIFASGSGAEDFMIDATENAKMMSAFTMNDAEYAIQANIIMISRLLAGERRTLNTVKKHWGAGFEMIYFDGRRFRKLDEVTYVINYARFNKEGDIPEIPVPAIILNYKYHGELLVITAIKPHKGTTIPNDTHYTITSNEFDRRKFIVKPLDYFGDDNLDHLYNDYSFSSHLNAMSYIIESEGGYYIPASINVGSELEIKYDDSDTITITMLRGISDRLTKEAKAVFPTFKF
jgi:hypothetical protein